MSLRLNLVGAAIAFGLATGAAATVPVQYSGHVFSSSDVGDPNRVLRVTYQAFSDGAGTARLFSNIGGTISFTLMGVSHSGTGSNITSSFRFLANVVNTSTAPMTNARISAIGFSTANPTGTGNNPAFVPLSSVGFVGTPDIYDVIGFNNSGMNIPAVAGSNRPQVCLKASGPSSNCTGGGGSGMQLGNPFPSTTSEFVLNFTGNTQRTSIMLHNFILRFQSLDGTGISNAGNGVLQGDSGVGIVTNMEIVPEPSSWAMLIAGFGLVGATLRRRRAVAA